MGDAADDVFDDGFRTSMYELEDVFHGIDVHDSEIDPPQLSLEEFESLHCPIDLIKENPHEHHI